LIPEKKEDRDRLRDRFTGKLIAPLFAFAMAWTREGRALLALWLFVAVASLDVMVSHVHVLFAAMTGLMVAALATRHLYRLVDCSIEVCAPATVFAGEPLDYVVRFKNQGSRDAWSVRFSLPFLPWDGTWIDPAPALAHVPRGGVGVVRSRARFDARGEHHLDACHASRIAPLGLTVGPATQGPGTRFLVLPRVANVVSIELEAPRGSHRERSGKPGGTGEADFAGVRPYRSGDAIRHLHARTWARTGKPHVMQFVDERLERVAMVLDLDGTLAPEARVEAAVSLAAGIAEKLLSDTGPGLARLVLGPDSFALDGRRGRAALDDILRRLALLTVGKTAPQQHQEPRLGAVSNAIVVTCDGTSARRERVDAIERLGIGVRWIEVVDAPRGGAAPIRIAASAIVNQEPVRC
jgi:uncharacterized protein (DUF58 family)